MSELEDDERDNLWGCEDEGIGGRDTLSVDLTAEGMVLVTITVSSPAKSCVGVALRAGAARRLADFLNKLSDRCDGGGS